MKVGNRRHGYPLAYASARRKWKKEGRAMRKLVFALLIAMALVLLLTQNVW